MDEQRDTCKSKDSQSGNLISLNAFINARHNIVDFGCTGNVSFHRSFTKLTQIYFNSIAICIWQCCGKDSGRCSSCQYIIVCQLRAYSTYRANKTHDQSFTVSANPSEQTDTRFVFSLQPLNHIDSIVSYDAIGIDGFVTIAAKQHEIICAGSLSVAPRGFATG